MEVSATTNSDAVSTTKRKRRPYRLVLLVLLGLIAIGGSLAVRHSSWARERRLRTLSLEELALAIHDSPNDASTFVYYGSSLLHAGNLQASEAAFQRAIQLQPKLAQAHLGLGSVRLRQGKLDEAKSAFEEAIRLEPQEPAAHLGLAQVYYLSGHPRNAIEPLKKVTALQPKNPVAWYYLGKMYGDAHQSDLAYEAIKQAVHLDPKQADYWRALGELANHYSRFKEAEEDFKQAIRLSPNDPLGHYWLGKVYARMGDTPELRGPAEQELLAAITRDPKMPVAYFELGQLYERHGNYSVAAANYKKASGLDPSDDQSLDHLGRCLVKTGRTAEGRKLIKGAEELGRAKREIMSLENRIRAEPTTRHLRLRMARMYRKYGNPESAMNQYVIYQRMGPPDPAAAKEAAAYQKELESQGVIPKMPPMKP